MKIKRPKHTTSRFRGRVRWKLEVFPWAMLAGGVLGLAAEIYTHVISALWMTSGGLLGGIAGAICDTAIFLYRFLRQSRSQPPTDGGHA